jgi:Tfp pilus assembly protein PilO
MSQVLERLNLRPQERRILVGVLTVVLVVLNAVFVWPHRKDWMLLQTELAKGRATLKTYRDEIARAPDYRARLAHLEDQGSAVLPADQANQLVRTVQNQAIQNNVFLSSIRPRNTPVASTNLYFDEQVVDLSLNTGDKELVEFLLALGSGGSMIRVRDINSLRPDSSQSKLAGDLTLVASYQKKPKAAPPPVAPRPPITAVRPPTAAAKPTNAAPKPPAQPITTTRKKT